jgi:predicted DNA-binding protein
MKKTISLRVPVELNDFLEKLANNRFTTKTQILLDFIVENYKYSKNDNSKKMLKSKMCQHCKKEI